MTPVPPADLLVDGRRDPIGVGPSPVLSRHAQRQRQAQVQVVDDEGELVCDSGTVLTSTRDLRSAARYAPAAR
ncbi:hypothetical protein [Amycolatopsis sp. FDAARGOS 1241]|uniref:hypothetical protein n=1 Tax=Amycolatopsis sp. FDAARGOS 1241 TaxID=2778070 RepID=UPI00194EE25A|nr:hypothetical protein [Amycolatopsis sp. FDAARGOS 1241]QRP48473.1 hypothetical protein I6J71_11850 [Amycolatopsis sp. FDAARGOS 1241]